MMGLAGLEPATASFPSLLIVAFRDALTTRASTGSSERSSVSLVDKSPLPFGIPIASTLGI